MVEASQCSREEACEIVTVLKFNLWLRLVLSIGQPTRLGHFLLKVKIELKSLRELI